MIIYEFTAELPAESVQAVFRSSGIKRPIDDPARIQKMFDNADIIVTARDGDTLVGVARALTDYSYCCYLSDLAVRHEYQGQGIGTEMIRMIREKIGETAMLLLLSAPDAMEYYPKIGFSKVENGWMITRSR